MRLLILLACAACTTTPTTSAEPAEPAPAPASAEHAQGHKMHGAEGAKHRFDDAEKWSKVFDDPARDAWQKPGELMKALDIAPGSTVADLGAGTGYLVQHLAGAVGPQGRVLALEVEPNLVKHMEERFADRPQVQVRQIAFEDAGLEPASVDKLVLVDVYHHIQDREAYFGKLRPALRPDGELVVVDFVMGDIPVGPPPGHRIPAEQVVRELAQAGFAEAATHDVLPYQFVKVFTPSE